MFPSDWNATETNLAGRLRLHAARHRPPRARLTEDPRTGERLSRSRQEPGGRFSGILRSDATRTAPASANRFAPGECLVWFLGSGDVVHVRSIPPRQAHERHKRKYAEGELEEERVFYFRGPENKLNLRIHNLTSFIQIARGIDDETWLFHLENHDYSNWMRNAIKDEELAEELSRAESESTDQGSSRSRIIKAIEAKYTVAE